MSTATNLITRALRRCRAIGRDQTASSDDATDGLEALNALLDLWWNERLFVYRVLDEAFNLSPLAISYTIGTGGDFNTTRPVKLVDSCLLKDGTTLYPLSLIGEDSYSAIQNLGPQGLPRYVYYDPVFPLGKIFFDIVPDKVYAFHCKSWQRLESLATLTENVDLPPGYDELIVNGLAINRAPEYGRSAPADVRLAFGRAARVLKRLNSTDPVLEGEFSGRRFNIFTDNS